MPVNGRCGNGPNGKRAEYRRIFLMRCGDRSRPETFRPLDVKLPALYHSLRRAQSAGNPRPYRESAAVGALSRLRPVRIPRSAVGRYAVVERGGYRPDRDFPHSTADGTDGLVLTMFTKFLIL